MNLDQQTHDYRSSMQHAAFAYLLLNLTSEQRLNSLGAVRHVFATDFVQF
ncbi:hypothetical protein [Pseudomonas gelidaquae]|nr:hypothetical protein [Pseudomonas sp. IB20]